MGQIEMLQEIDENGCVGLPRLDGISYSEYKLSYTPKGKALLLSKDKGKKVSISSNFRLHIPESLLAATELKAGDKVVFYTDEESGNLLIYKIYECEMCGKGSNTPVRLFDKTLCLKCLIRTIDALF